MSRVVVDASALAAVAFQEPGSEAVLERLKGATVFAPTLLRYELANTALKKCRRHPEIASELLAALGRVLSDDAIIWHDVDPVDTAMIGRAIGATAYDSSYLWLAGSLGADLVTLDGPLARAAETVIK